MKFTANVNVNELTKKGDIICPFSGEVAIGIALHFQKYGLQGNPTTLQVSMGQKSGFVINTWTGISLADIRVKLKRWDLVIWRSDVPLEQGDKKPIQRKELFNMVLPLP